MRHSSFHFFFVLGLSLLGQWSHVQKSLFLSNFSCFHHPLKNYYNIHIPNVFDCEQINEIEKIKLIYSIGWNNVNLFLTRYAHATKSINIYIDRRSSCCFFLYKKHQLSLSTRPPSCICINTYIPMAFYHKFKIFCMSLVFAELQKKWTRTWVIKCLFAHLPVAKL